MGKTVARRVPAAMIVVGLLALPGIAQGSGRPAFKGISISADNRSGSTFTVSVQVIRASTVGVCVGVAHTNACEYATKHGGTTFNARFHIAGARRTSQIEYSISASGPGGHRFTSGRLVEGSGTGTTTIG